MVPPTLCWVPSQSRGECPGCRSAVTHTAAAAARLGPAPPPAATSPAPEPRSAVRGAGPARPGPPTSALRRSRSQIPLLCASPSAETGVCLAPALVVPPGDPLEPPWHVCRCEVMVSLHSLGAMALS